MKHLHVMGSVLLLATGTMGQDCCELNETGPLAFSGAGKLDGVGTSLDISGAFAIVGSPGYDTGGNSDVGRAAIFERESIGWVFRQLLGSLQSPDDFYFGTSVAIDDTEGIAVVGAPQSGTSNTGLVEV